MSSDNAAFLVTRTIAAALLIGLFGFALHMEPANAQQHEVTMNEPSSTRVVDHGRAVARLFAPGPVDPTWFTPDFLAAVPATRVDAIVEELTADFGAFVAARVTDGEGVAELERALVPVSISLDGEGRIAGLLLRPPEPTGGEVTSIAERIAGAAQGEVAVLATEQITELAPEADAGAWSDRVVMRADAPMAVGSAFKLAVLRAYEDAVEAGTLRRADVTDLTEGDRSLPSGVLHTLRPGTPVTLEVLAGLMIAHSDNTATDALIRVVGRDAMEAISPRNRPFLTTAELFKLAAVGNEAHRAAYAAGDEAERRTVLRALAAMPLPRVDAIRPRATWQDAEWFMTARELCALLVSLRDAPALNGVPQPLVAVEGWPWVGFKGGSEFGVLNLSAAGTTPDGRTICAVVTANAAEAQPDDRLALLFGALFRRLAGQGE